MAARVAIKIRTGASSWLKRLHFIVLALAVGGILAANSNWVFRLAALTAIVFVTGLSLRDMSRTKRYRVLHIHTNGLVSLLDENDEETPGVLEPGAWVSRYLSLVKIGRLDVWRPAYLIICASRNSAEEYRRLLKILRHPSPG